MRPVLACRNMTNLPVGNDAQVATNTREHQRMSAHLAHFSEHLMEKAHGVITLAQEHRFQLIDDQGMRRLFIVAHGAAVQGRDLERLARSRRPVTVFYTQSEMLNGHTAQDVHEDEADDTPHIATDKGHA